MKHITITTMCLILFISSNLFAKNIHKVFSGKTEIEIKCILGSCEINKSKDKKVHIDLEYSWKDDEFEAKFINKKDKLKIEEKLNNSGSNGNSFWIISVPDNMDIEFNSATGSLSIHGINAEVDASSGTGYMQVNNTTGGEYKLGSGTGRIEVSDCQGEFDLNSGTGYIKVNDSKGKFKANSGTGSVKMNSIIIDDDARLNSGTGKVEITSISGHDFDLNLNSGTGNVLLDLDGKKIDGEYIFTIDEDHAKIVCPFKFDQIEELDNEQVRKSFTVGKSTTIISLSTGTGKAVLKK